MSPSRWNRRWKAVLAWFLCLLCAVAFAGRLLVVSEMPQKADAIVVIGGDHKPERIRRAVELYPQGYAPVVVISSGTQVLEGHEWVREAEVMRRQALALGLPETVLLIEDESRSTFLNAYYVRALCNDRGFRSVLLVTSIYHSRRARRIFRDVFGSDISISTQPAPQALCDFCWWFQPDQVPVVLYE